MITLNKFILMKNIKNITMLVFCLVCYAGLAFGETYYISQQGNDNNSGLSPVAPWKTIRKAVDGNRYLLKRGDSFSFLITKLYDHEKRYPGKQEKIIIDAYGLGKKPVIDLYRKITGGWVKEGPNVWKLDLVDEENNNKAEANIGFLNINNKIFGSRKLRLTDLDKQWDFYCDNKTIHLYSAVSPNNSTIKLARNYTAIFLSNNMEIANIKIIGTGAHAIQGVGVENVSIRNVDISEIGGSYLDGHTDGTRYGNGIEFYEGATNCSVRNSTVSEVYDAAFTCQGYKPNSLFKQVIFENNRCSNNEQSFEFWVGGVNSSFVKCVFANNRCFNAGYGWAHDVRPDKDVGVHILNYSFDFANCDLVIKNNLFDNARSGYMYSAIASKQTKGFKSLRNQIILNKGIPLKYQRDKKSLTNHVDLINTMGLEIDSKVTRK